MRTENRLTNRRIGLILVLMALVPAMSVAGTLYVKQGANGNGTSWTNAYGDLQDALDAAVLDTSIDEIWVAAGVYVPTSDYGLGLGSRGKHFRMIEGVEIYGGFPNTVSPAWDERNPSVYVTTLSGDLNGNDGPNFSNNADNCYHVFYHPQTLSLGPSAVLNGFTITAGNSGDKGGGMYNYSSSPTVEDCIFSDNMALRDGAGMFNYFMSNPTLTGCTFSGNVSGTLNDGGGMYNMQSNPILTDCTFIGNSAEYGGGMYNYNSDPVLTACYFYGNAAKFGGGVCNLNSNADFANCVFSGNTSDSGGGMYNQTSDPILTYCTFSNNESQARGAGIYNHNNCAPTLINCILYNNIAPLSDREIYNYLSTSLISYSNIAGCLNGTTWNTSVGTDEGHNMNTEPFFVDPDGLDNIVGTEDDNLRLSSNSPCIGAGSNGTDMGAYEDAVAPSPMLSSITIGGPLQVDESSSAEYTATAYYSDGSSADVTSDASWTVTAYASITSSGTLTTDSVSSNQSCTVTATYGGKSDTHTLTINDVPTTGGNLTVSSSGASNVQITSTTGFGGTTNYSRSVADGALVILRAPATANGATFTGWSGSVTSSSEQIWFTMSGTKSVTANY
ncbi:MAG: right-handed parallel beta-helix repeat-containing protein, partial [Planctomycetota bacterium]